MAANDQHAYLVESQDLTGSGYGLDIGGSLAKLAYVTQEEDHRGKKCVYTKTFHNDQLEEMVAFIRQHCELGPPESTVTVTGFGSFSNKDKLERSLNARLDVVIEFGCFAKALTWSLKNLPTSKVFYPPSAEAQRKASEVTKAFANLGDVMTSVNEAETCSGEESNVSESVYPTSSNDNSLAAPENYQQYYVGDDDNPADNFPCMVAMIGSGIGNYVVSENRELCVLGASNFGGQSLTGLSKMVTGTKDFEELMDLAAKGDCRGVDTCGLHLKATGSSDNEASKFYSAFPENETIYYFGQLNESDGPFKKEDLALSLVTSFAIQHITVAMAEAKLHGLKRIFLAGSLPQHPHMRTIMEQHLLRKFIILDSTNKDMKFGFLRNGGELGAFGTLLL